MNPRGQVYIQETGNGSLQCNITSRCFRTSLSGSCNINQRSRFLIQLLIYRWSKECRLESGSEYDVLWIHLFKSKLDNDDYATVSIRHLLGCYKEHRLCIGMRAWPIWGTFGGSGAALLSRCRFWHLGIFLNSITIGQIFNWYIKLHLTM